MAIISWIIAEQNSRQYEDNKQTSTLVKNR